MMVLQCDKAAERGQKAPTKPGSGVTGDLSMDHCYEWACNPNELLLTSTYALVSSQLISSRDPFVKKSNLNLLTTLSKATKVRSMMRSLPSM